MKNKRYAILEVNYDNCPIKYIIPHKKTKCMPFKCNECGMHGDTEKDLIIKVTQVLKRETGCDGIVIRIGENIGDIKSIMWEDVAEVIIKFLGVKK